MIGDSGSRVLIGRNDLLHKMQGAISGRHYSVLGVRPPPEVVCKLRDRRRLW